MEFVALRDRISHSLNFACVLVDMNVLELITSVRRYVVILFSDIVWHHVTLCVTHVTLCNIV